MSPVWIDGEYSEIGHTPGQAGVQSLLRRLEDRDDAGVFATRLPCGRLFRTAPGRSGETSAECSRCRPCRPRPRRTTSSWFRRLRSSETVDLGRQPRESHPDGRGHRKSLTPRASFAAWRETVRGRSLPWKPNEIRGGGGAAQVDCRSRCCAG